MARSQGFRELSSVVTVFVRSHIEFISPCYDVMPTLPNDISDQPAFCLWCFSFLSAGLVRSSKNTNITAPLSVGLSGVNFTAGRTEAYNCCGTVCYLGHAYSASGPWACAPCPKPNPQLFTCFFLYPHSILFLFIPPCCFPASRFLSTSQAWRDQRRLIGAAEVKRETRAWSWGPGSPQSGPDWLELLL